MIGLDVRHGCVSVPCLAYVTGLDVRNGSGERSMFGSREWTIFFDLSFLLGNKMPM